MSALFAVLMGKLKGLLLPFAGIALGAALIWGAIQKADAQHEKKLRVKAEAALVQFAREVETKTAKAKADDLAHARAVEAKNDTIRQENANAIQRTLAAELANARRVRTSPAADPGGRGQPDLSGTGNATGHPDVSAAASELDASDRDICTTAVVLLEGWQRWHAETLKASDR